MKERGKKKLQRICYRPIHHTLAVTGGTKAGQMNINVLFQQLQICCCIVLPLRHFVLMTHNYKNLLHHLL